MHEVMQRWFDRHAAELVQVSRTLWERPEASEQEHFACRTLSGLMAEHGFTVAALPPAGLDTAFEASWGSGAPHIGFLAEYDALPGLSQETSPRPEPIPGQAFGHGCGHNLLGTGAAGAAIALRAVMEAEGLPGTVYLYGCPSEEVMMGKIIMTQAHVFDHLDAAISWHPGDRNRASEESYQAMLSMEYHFTGKASHASMAPQEGLSALDAGELLDVGVTYLREHVPPGGQIHYVILNGGEKPNIVPEKASVWQFIRANTAADLRRIAARMDDIAAGAALMTGTSYTKKIVTGCNETKIVPPLVDVMHQVMTQEVMPPVWSPEEEAFSRRLLESLELRVPEHPLHGGVSAPKGETIDILGSSDLSDVSYVVPTCMLFSACYPMGTPNHTWAVTACAGHSIGQKGMLYAARVMAAIGLRLTRDPVLRQAVRTSFQEALGETRYAPVNI